MLEIKVDCDNVSIKCDDGTLYDHISELTACVYFTIEEIGKRLNAPKQEIMRLFLQGCAFSMMMMEDNEQ